MQLVNENGITFVGERELRPYSNWKTADYFLLNADMAINNIEAVECRKSVTLRQLEYFGELTFDTCNGIHKTLKGVFNCEDCEQYFRN